MNTLSQTTVLPNKHNWSSFSKRRMHQLSNKHKSMKKTLLSMLMVIVMLIPCMLMAQRGGSFGSSRSSSSSFGGGSSFSRSSGSSFGSSRSSFGGGSSFTSPTRSSSSFGSSRQSVMGSSRSSYPSAMSAAPSRPMGSGSMGTRTISRPATTSTTFSSSRVYQLGTRPTVRYTNTYVIGGRTAYYYPGGGYSYSIGGPIVGYYDPPVYAQTSMGQPVIVQNTNSFGATVLWMVIGIVVIVGIIALIARSL